MPLASWRLWTLLEACWKALPRRRYPWDMPTPRGNTIMLVSGDICKHSSLALCFCFRLTHIGKLMIDPRHVPYSCRGFPPATASLRSDCSLLAATPVSRVVAYTTLLPSVYFSSAVLTLYWKGPLQQPIKPVKIPLQRAFSLWRYNSRPLLFVGSFCLYIYI